MRATIKDIAKISGMSVSTVSRVLSNHPHVSQRAQERVTQAAQAIGYIPNSAARSLVSKQRRLIGLVVPEMENPFYNEIISGVELTAARHGFGTVLSCKMGNVSQEDDSISKLVELGVDGVIHSGLLNDEEVNKKLLKWKVPSVLLGRVVHDLDLSYVVFNDRDSAWQGTQHLLRLGHRRIAFLFGKPTSDSSVRKLEGYRAALADAGISFSEELVAAGGLTFEGGKAAAAQLLARTHFTAVMAGNDMMALGARDCFLERGIRIPQDVSLVGIDDIFWSSLQLVGLTTVRVPKFEMGRRCCEILLKQIADETCSHEQIVLTGELICRNSCQRPQGGVV